MTLESSIFPVPSELVMIPAGISAINGTIDPFLAILVGWLWSVVWALLLNYWILGRWLGKPFLEKYGKYILITHTKYKKAEDLFPQKLKSLHLCGTTHPCGSSPDLDSCWYFSDENESIYHDHISLKDFLVWDTCSSRLFLLRISYWNHSRIRTWTDLYSNSAHRSLSLGTRFLRNNIRISFSMNCIYYI